MGSASLFRSGGQAAPYSVPEPDVIAEEQEQEEDHREHGEDQKTCPDCAPDHQATL